jgi:hydrogenase maturation protein HypF
MVLVKTEKLVKIRVRGVVQGVGFRPFVYRLACEHNLKGWVRNTSGEVEIEAEGAEAALGSFLDELKTQAPPAARIEALTANFQEAAGHTGFVIRKSQRREKDYQLVSPDIVTCRDCVQEIFDPADRRYRYPFTNCTNCGPRFTIIEDIPYDRPQTTMRHFRMCPTCKQEYDDPLDRRFHAQPNACPVCGPRLSLVDSVGKPVDCDDAIIKASELLKCGSILSLKGLGGFQLACDATNDTAVNTLRARKRRPAKPFAVMMPSLADIEKQCEVSGEERRLLESPECPIVLVRWRQGESAISPCVAPNLRYLGVMLPYTPLHHLLIRETGLSLIMTSGNLSEEPIASDNDEALHRLSNIADYFLMHNRDIAARYDDSVYLVADKTPQAVRRARGYAPYPIFLPFATQETLACGADEKNTFCLTRDNHAFVSQHIGDMENEETLEHFERTIESYKKLFRIEPKLLACDMHPEYLSTKYAQEASERLGLPLIPVQHHHAHIASCLADNNASGPVIGVAFDGTGFGADGTIWGGEFLIADYAGFRRAGHLETVPLIGGAAAIRKPYRMALSYLYSLMDKDFPITGLPLTTKPGELEIIKEQLASGVNSPLTSSSGRLFDGVAAIAGVRGEIDYEAQAAIELEMLAPDALESDDRVYPFAISGGEVREVRLAGLIGAVVRDVRDGVPAPLISLRFHRTVTAIITGMCLDISRESGLKTVALSGGVFQNRLLLKLATTQLAQAGFKVLTHHLVSTNDGGISLGQAAIASVSLRS